MLGTTRPARYATHQSFEGAHRITGPCLPARVTIILFHIPHSLAGQATTRAQNTLNTTPLLPASEVSQVRAEQPDEASKIGISGDSLFRIAPDVNARTLFRLSALGLLFSLTLGARLSSPFGSISREARVSTKLAKISRVFRGVKCVRAH